MSSAPPASGATHSDVWDRGRTSDGINSFGHVFEHGHDRLSLWGRIWERLGQTLHMFWLEVKRSARTAARAA